jgi:hypothetical protein
MHIDLIKFSLEFKKVRIFPITDKKKKIIVYAIAKQNKKRRYRIVDFKLDKKMLTLSECHKQRVWLLDVIRKLTIPKIV